MDDLDEKVLDIQQRQKRAQIMRRYKTKIERAREIAKKRMAPEANIRKRAYAQARQIVRRRVAGARGAEYEKLGPSEKIAIDRAVEGKQKAIKKLALRLIPRVKQAESKRLHAFMQGHQIHNQGQPEGKSKESSGSSSVKEELNYLFTEAFPQLDTSNALGQKVDSPIASSNKKMPPKGKSKNSAIIQYNKFNEEVEFDTPAFASLFKKSEKSGIDLEVLGEVYNRGWNIWTEDCKVSQQQYAFARVNSFINQGKTYFNEDADLHEGMDSTHPIVKEYNALKKQDIKTLRNMIGRQHKVVDTSEFKTKDHAATHLLRQKHGDKKVDQAFGFNEARSPGRAYVAPFNDEQGKQRGWKSSDKWGKVKYWQPHAKKSAMKHAGLQEEEVQQTNENFIDGKGPGKPGDSARHGLKGKSATELRKIRSSDSASPRKKQLAHWMLNMHHNEETDINELSAKTIDAYRRGMEKDVAINQDMDPQKRERRLKGFKTSTNKVIGIAKINVKEGLKDPEDNPCWDGYKPVGTKKKAGKVVPNCVPEDVQESYDVNSKHYKALTDLDLNTKNRDMTTQNDGYGPLNPMDKKGSKAFWDDKAKMWNTTTEAAMEARCGNCAAFNQAPAIMKKMAEGLGPAGEKIQDLADLGFCELFEFKCAAARTCNKWLVNGPITEEDTGNGTRLVDKESRNSKIRKKIEVVDRKPPHTEYTRQAELYRKIVEDHPNCGTPECCGQCDTAVTEKIGNVQKDPKKRLIGTDSLVKAYKTDTPGQHNESINESFNIAFASGVGVTLTAADLGMKVQGGFSLHPSVIEQMDEMEEEVRSADIKGVVVRTADGKTIVRKQKANRKIIGTGNLTDGEPNDTL